MCWISLLRQCNLQLICVMYFMTVFVWKVWFLITVCNLGAILWYKYSIPHRHLELGLLITNIWLFFDILCAVFFCIYLDMLPHSSESHKAVGLPAWFTFFLFICICLITTWSSYLCLKWLSVISVASFGYFAMLIWRRYEGEPVHPTLGKKITEIFPQTN